MIPIDPDLPPPPSGRMTMLNAGMLIWILATGLFFYLRFTFIFYFANRDAIRAFLGV